MGMVGNFIALEQADLDALYDEPTAIEAILQNEQDRIFDIGKAWHGIHFMLTGQSFGGEGPLARVVFGEAPIGEAEIGYGPALGSSIETVQQIASALAELSPFTFRKRHTLAELEEAEIYPACWDEGPRALDELEAGFITLKQFYSEAAAQKLAVITFIS